MKCSKCNKEISDESKFCQYCGVTINNDSKKIYKIKDFIVKNKIKCLCIILTIFVIFIILFCTGGKFNFNKPLVSQITSDDYGKNINYSVTVKGTELNDWKVFYNDGNNVYIILSGYLENYLLPESTRMIKSGIYSTYWSKKFLSTPYNQSAVDILTNTANWVLFKNDYAESATGAPTIEMYTSSWNAKGYTPIYYGKDSENVYALSFDSDNLDIGKNTYNDMSDEIYERGIRMNLEMPSTEEGYNDILYYPYHEAINDCHGYWIAGRNYYSDYYIYVVAKSGDIVSNPIDKWDRASLRPVICLKSDVTGKIDENAVIIDE